MTAEEGLTLEATIIPHSAEEWDAFLSVVVVGGAASYRHDILINCLFPLTFPQLPGDKEP